MSNISKKILPYALALSVLLSGCGKKSECDLPTKHVHKYTKVFENGITLEKYLYDEHLEVSGGYNWNENYIEITKQDEELYKKLDSKGLFLGSDNWDYLFREMATHHDYLEFFYEYDTVETYTTTDSDGNVQVHTRIVHHSGWTNKPNYSNNTGRTRLYHHRYYGYRVLYTDGKFKLEKSEAVDDIRDVINEYPYFGENCIEEVYEEFKFPRRELSSLSPYDFDVFESPNLENKELSNGTSKTLIK